MLTAPPVNPCSFSFTIRTTTHHHQSISKRFNIFTVSANFQRKKNNRYRNLSPHNYDFDEEEEEEVEEEEEITGIGHVLMKSLKSDNPPNTIDAIQKEPKPTSRRLNSERNSVKEEEEEEEEEGKVELNGMDVLMALSRAKSQTRGKPTRRRKKGSSDMKVSGRGKEEDNDDSIMDYRDVKPLNVKSDWGTRLDECEKSLQQLLLHQKF